MIERLHRTSKIW